MRVWHLSHWATKAQMSLYICTDSPEPLLSFLFFSFSIYCQTLFRVLSAGVLCTLRVEGWKPTSNHIKITVGFFKLHKGWFSLHRGHPVNVPIRRTMHLSSVIPANERESVFGHRNFPCRERGSNLGPLAPKASAKPLSYHPFRSQQTSCGLHN